MSGSKKLKSVKNETYARKRAIEKLGPAAAFRASRDCSNMSAATVSSNAKRLERATHTRLRIQWLEQNPNTPQEGPGRPTEYRDSYSAQAKHLTKLGAIDAELAEFFDVDETTINRWKHAHPEFCQSIKDGKIVTDMEVAVKLNARATGFEYQEAHPIKLKEVQYQDGKKVSEIERIEIVNVAKVIPPDTAAAIFWLTNRRRKQWKQRGSTEVTGADDKPLFTEEPMSKLEMARQLAFMIREGAIAAKAAERAAESAAKGGDQS